MKFTQEMADAQNARFDESGRKRNNFVGTEQPPLYGPVAPTHQVCSFKPKPILNKLESNYRDHLKAQGYTVREQAITLRLDPPFKSYRPDLAYLECEDWGGGGLVLVECKGPHRFREKGIAKFALAAKTYPEFSFVLVERNGSSWKETKL